MMLSPKILSKIVLSNLSNLADDPLCSVGLIKYSLSNTGSDLTMPLRAFEDRYVKSRLKKIVSRFRRGAVDPWWDAKAMHQFAESRNTYRGWTVVAVQIPSGYRCKTKVYIFRNPQEG